MEGCISKSRISDINTSKLYFTITAVRKKDLKNKLWKRYQKNRSDYDNNRFKRAKNEFRCRTRSLRRQFENNIVKYLKTAAKKFWKYMQSKTKMRNKKSTLMKQDGIKFKGKSRSFK